MEPLNNGEVRKTGTLKKLGGGGGGHKNWKDRFFVLDDHLSYYNKEADYTAKKKALGRIVLNAYYAGPAAGGEKKFEFAVNAYPKSLVCRASSETEMKEWIDAIMQPLTDMDSHVEPADAGAAVAAAGAGAGAGAAS